MDYSYEITPLSQLHNANTSNFKPHIPQPNWGMPAYVAGRLAWGSPPVAVRFLVFRCAIDAQRCRAGLRVALCAAAAATGEATAQLYRGAPLLLAASDTDMAILPWC